MARTVAVLSGLLALSLALSCTGTPAPTLRATPSPSPALQSIPTPTVAPAPTQLPNAPDLDLYSLAQRLSPSSDQSIPKVVNPEPVSYQEGQVDLFWVIDLVDMQVRQVETVLSHVSDHAYWYFEKGSEPSESALEIAARVFEDRIYPTVTGLFGKEWTPGVDNDSRITILHARLQGAAGYYSAADEYPREVYPYSNEREMVYMSTRNLPLGSDSYLGTLAHELQHAVHWATDPGEETWVNEGLSEVAKGLAGYSFSFIDDFISSPGTPLTAWPSDGQSSFPYYGAATLFMEYLAQHYGGHDSLGRLVERPEDGMEGVTAYLREMGYQESFEDVFRGWLVANYLDSLEIDGYYYEGLDVKVGSEKTMRGSGEHRDVLPQYAGDYIEVELGDDSVLVAFQGRAETPLLPTTPHSGSYCWWGNRGDSIDSSLTSAFDLSQVSEATLEFWPWYAIEESWDYAYVEVSTDGGVTWKVLVGQHATPENPVGNGFGPGYTGRSKGWVRESVDLTPYAGREVLLRFEYVTDSAINEDGICIDDISIPQIGYFDDAEGEGTWEALGFIRTDNRVAQRYLVQVIELGDGVAVRSMTLDEEMRGAMVVQGSGAGVERAVVVIAPMAPGTTISAPYTLSVGPVGE